MIRAATILPILALTACATAVPVSAPAPEAAAPATPNSAKARFVTAAEANGCVVNEGNSKAILAGATLSSEDLARIMQELISEGRGEIAADGKSFRVTTGACA